MTIWIVEQFGFAIILSPFFIAWLLISGTTRGTFFSILQADELSITTVPFLANSGAHSFDVEAPAEKIAKTGFAFNASVTLTTLTAFPLNINSLPTERSEAAGISSDTGKFLSSRTLIIVRPTSPVAPTTAVFIIDFV